MKHYSRNARRKNRRAATQQPQQAVEDHQAPPTPEQLSGGSYAAPQGQGRKRKPYVNTTPDLIGVLFKRGKITGDEEQAARHFQRIRAAYVAELGVTGYRSCLDQTRGGHDDSDGDLAAIAAYDSLRQLLGPRHCAFVARETDKPATQRAEDLRRLKLALRRIAGA